MATGVHCLSVCLSVCLCGYRCTQSLGDILLYILRLKERCVHFSQCTGRCVPLRSRSTYGAVKALRELSEFLQTPDPRENKNRQKLLRNLRVRVCICSYYVCMGARVGVHVLSCECMGARVGVHVLSCECMGARVGVHVLSCECMGARVGVHVLSCECMGARVGVHVLSCECMGARVGVHVQLL